MANSAEAKKKAVARLRRIQGQAQALERAVNEGVESSKLLQQVSAMRGATDGLMAELLDDHMRQTLGKGTKQAAEVEQVIRLVRSYMK
jgi:DNA-binding FrmR family transcriptional regulator